MKRTFLLILATAFVFALDVVARAQSVPNPDFPIRQTKVRTHCRIRRRDVLTRTMMRAFLFLAAAIALAWPAAAQNQIADYTHTSPVQRTDKFLMQRGIRGTPYSYANPSDLFGAMIGQDVAAALGYTPTNNANAAITGGTVADADISGALATSTGASSQSTLANILAEKLDVTFYGARNDAVGFSDGIISSGSANLSSASASFASGDVGKTIVVDGIGPNGFPLQTTIASVIDARHVTLSAAASTASADYFAAKAAVVTSQSGSGSYAPGEVITLSGGAAVQQPRLTTVTTALAAAAINAGGSGGTNGPCVVGGTTGVGRRFRINVTISGNAITAIGSVVDAGSYTGNPSSLSAEPVTGCGLTSATLAIKMGYATGYLSPRGSYSVLPSNPVSQGSSTGSGTGLTVALAGAPSNTFVYGTDNAAAIGSAVSKSNALQSSGTRVCIYFPAVDSRSGVSGGYLVASRPTQFSLNNPGCIVGDGTLKSFVIVGAGLSGSLFSWDEAWGLTNPYTGSYPANTAWNGPSVANISFVADSNSGQTQHALSFSDRNDFVLLQNVDVYYFTGSCLSIGKTGIQTSAYMRESRFDHVRMWGCGSALNPAVLISSAVSGTDDSTNELSFYGLDIIYSNGKSLVINGNNPAKDTGLIRFYGLRIEGGSDDFITLGDPLLSGAVSGIWAYGLDLITIPSGGAGVRAVGPTLARGPANIHMFGSISSGAGNGIVIGQSRGNMSFNVDLDVSGIDLVVGPSSSVAGPIYVDGSGMEYLWSTSIDPTSIPSVKLPGLRYGSPGGQVNVLANVHDGSPGRGNTPGAGAVDLQSFRTAATRTASGESSTISGGQDNTASQYGSTVSGGDGNTASGFRSTVAGGFGATAAGAYSSVVGGIGCVLSGNYSTCLGGQDATDRNDTSMAWAVAAFSTPGDQQRRESIMSAVLSSTSPTRLTVDGNAAGTLNGITIPTGTLYKTAVEASCRDTVSPANWATWNIQEGAVQRQSSTPTYSGAASTATTPSQSGGTANAATLTIGADTTNNVISVSVAWPNSDVTHCTSYTRTLEVQ